MGSNGKKKTTFAKLNREQKVRDRRIEKQARKDARKLAAANEQPSATAEIPLARRRTKPSADRPGRSDSSLPSERRWSSSSSSPRYTLRPVSAE